MTADSPSMAGGLSLVLEARPDRLTDAVYEAIRRGIIEKRLAPGQPVTEAALADQLGVSKTPVREALLRLREVGVIEPHRRRGGRVVQCSAARIQHAFELREALESSAARLAAERATVEDTSRLQAIAARSFEHAGDNDLPAFRDEDMEFHSAVGTAARNPALARIIDDALTLALTLRRRDRPQATVSLACADAHVRIADAIAEGDAAAAEHEMRSHIRFVLAAVAADPSANSNDEVVV